MITYSITDRFEPNEHRLVLGFDKHLGGVGELTLERVTTPRRLNLTEHQCRVVELTAQQTRRELRLSVAENLQGKWAMRVFGPGGQNVLVRVREVLDLFTIRGLELVEL